MTADEHEAEPFVGDQLIITGEPVLGIGFGPGRIGSEPFPDCLPTHLVKRPAIGDAIQPGSRVSGRSGARPAARRRLAGFGKGVLGDIEIAKPGGERCDHAPRRRPNGAIERRFHLACLALTLTEQRPDFDRAFPVDGDLLGNGDRVIEVVGFDQIEAA